ncbi:MAG: class I SAM-dependent methyltransferase [Clostridiales bacterium]|uniref:class I SAM-dependent methyltransferase n=1 Tax=Candidatus Wunengus sp. YC61 TaxID=3367698 RepID=UPI002723017B|nr:class I SAM-dependent methyltransferase [Clostridiales bacterium]
MLSVFKNQKTEVKERATGTACYLCGNDNYKQKDGCVRDNARLKVLECCNCGLVFLSSFDHVGRDFYENSGMHGESPHNFHELLNEAVLDDERRFEFIKPLLINCSVLDFGCGTGGFLHRVKSLARVAHGIELEKRFAKYYQQMDMQVFANISSVPDGNCYDIITLFHVLEHLPDPKATLIQLSRFLKENGKIIIEVPNSDDALLTLYQCKDFQSFTYWSCHLYLFNSSTLSNLAEQAGLKINYIKQVQRYSLANHLYWLCQGKPGGHQHWQFFNTPELHGAYEAQLAALGKCDTLMMSLSFC